ncbi:MULTISPECIES: flavodoxin [Bacillus]|uniref:Flavodoxin n=1 Tax=Bacillus spizizenii (strain DSM 15029 / JCM 12233 / NBRC 101239 / NRRL B-23049 / TU-B-10) TaxID=1052585 RepID=G4NVN4_BACS4|nr:flavodoxin [Bacillus spizizenii]APH68316.1 flavodoxin [Bacillus subtilis]AEP86392.1 flavodoxin [Bacillus spizizenii TU-B-10]KXJ36156.1 flavodoxin [Bacillus spizizenii]MBK4202746.1 flavodoxin [Bacillus subtilis]MCI4167011.1 flavodoxin [Bacillus spizizenii]
MGKILLVYATMSGNTEAMADLIEKGLQEAEVEADRFEAIDIDNAQLFNDYDHIIMGTYTWGDGDLPDEFLDLAEDMDEIDFSGKTCAVFGSGDTAYEFFCGAVDTLEAKIKERGGEIVLPSVKIENNPEGEEEEELMEFGRQFAKKSGIAV